VTAITTITKYLNIGIRSKYL